MTKTGFVTLEEFADLEHRLNLTQAALSKALAAVQQLQACVIRLNDIEIKRIAENRG